MSFRDLTLLTIIFGLGLSGGLVSARRLFLPKVPLAHSSQVDALTAPNSTPDRGERSVQKTDLPAPASPSSSASPPLANLLQVLQEKNPALRDASEDQIIAHLDPKQLTDDLQQIAQQRQGEVQVDVESKLLDKLSQSDPAAAINFTSTLTNRYVAQELASQLIKTIAATDVKTAWQLTSQLPPGLGRNRLWRETLESWANKDPASAAQYLLSLKSDPSNPLLSGQMSAYLAGKLFKNDPAAASNFIAQLPDGEAKKGAVDGLALQLLSIDPKATADLVTTLLPNSDTVTRVMDHWGIKDTAGAIAYAEQNLKGRALSESMRYLLPRLAKKDPQKALDIASQLGNDEIPANLMYRLPESLKLTDPQQALTYVANVPEGPLRDRFFAGLAKNMVESASPQSASQWISSLPDSESKGAAMKELAAQWSWRDPKSVASWLQTSSPGPNLDQAISSFQQAASYSHPETTTPLCLLISDAPTRERVIRSSFSSWQRNDPQAATNWLNSSSLDSTLKQQLLSSK